eukprot:m.23273 g.23273  ORF g.23273 m.23273 type:complete len:150 (+) comp8471_c0_seq1:1686-2135(+)
MYVLYPQRPMYICVYAHCFRSIEGCALFVSFMPLVTFCSNTCLQDGKAKIRTLIANLQSTTKSLQRVDEVNSRLQHSTRKVDEALVKYSQAEAIAPGVAHESSKGNGMADPFGALARPPPSTSRRQPSQRPSRTQVKAPAAAADPWAPQ